MTMTPPDISSPHFRLLSQGEQALINKDYNQAFQAFSQALSLHPQDQNTLINLGITCNLLDKPKKALTYLLQARTLDPQNPLTLSNIAHSYRLLYDYTQAIAVYQDLVSRHPLFVPGLLNLAITLVQSSQIEVALGYYRQTLALQPEHIPTHLNLALALTLSGDKDAAEEQLQITKDLVAHITDPEAQAPHRLTLEAVETHLAELQTLSTKTPHNIEVQFLSHLYQSAFTPAQICLNYLVRLQRVKPHQNILHPYFSCTLLVDPSFHLKVAHNYCHNLSPKTPLPAWPLTQLRINPTIGYLTEDYHDHAITHLILNFLQASQLTNIAFSYAKTYTASQSPDFIFQKKVQQRFTKFINLESKSVQAAAQIIHRFPIDILIDLKGLTFGHRLEIAAFRPAPLIIHFLGNPGSIGANFVDYFIADPIVAPLQHHSFFSESLLTLPHTYQSPNNATLPSTTVANKTNFGIAPDQFVFASFNYPFKFNQLHFQVWLNLLKKIPQSVLWLLVVPEMSRDHLQYISARQGVNPNRLVFSTRLPKDQHLKRMQLADLSLDTFPVNGHTTTSDSLWAGVPVVTLLGDHFASRVSASLLTSIGLSEMITHNLADYHQLALYLATHPNKLKAIRSKLLANQPSYPLFDVPRFTHNLETAYLTVWDNYLAGKSPQPFNITDPLPLIHKS